MGRFLSQDTWATNFRNPIEYNRYSYAASNPATYSDPSGHSALAQLGQLIDKISSRTVAKARALSLVVNTTYARITTWILGSSFISQLPQILCGLGTAAEIAIEDAEVPGACNGANFGIAKGIKAGVNNIKNAVRYVAGKIASVAKWLFDRIPGSDKIARFFSKTVDTVVQYVARAWQNIRGPRAPSADDIAESTGSNRGNSGSDGGHTPIGNPLDDLCSFSGDTLVSTTDGLVAIVDIEVDDTVYAYHEADNVVGTYGVTATISHIDAEITFVTIYGETIETTPWHDFYTDEGWEDAGDLQVGDLILSLDGNYYVVDSVETMPGEQVMYDLTVDDAHTFAVGTGQWVVHNKCISTPNGYIITVPDNYVFRPANSGKGSVYQKPGSVRDNDSIRIMDPDPRYPDGYVVYTNSTGQPIDPSRGVAGNNNDQTHIPLSYVGPIIGWPK